MLDDHRHKNMIGENGYSRIRIRGNFFRNIIPIQQFDSVVLASLIVI